MGIFDRLDNKELSPEILIRCGYNHNRCINLFRKQIYFSNQYNKGIRSSCSVITLEGGRFFYTLEYDTGRTTNYISCDYVKDTEELFDMELWANEMVVKIDEDYISGIYNWQSYKYELK